MTFLLNLLRLPFMAHKLNEFGRNDRARQLMREHGDLDGRTAMDIAFLEERYGMRPCEMEASFSSYVELATKGNVFWKPKRGRTYEQLKAEALQRIENSKAADREDRIFKISISIVCYGFLLIMALAFLAPLIWPSSN